jgi:hypothetical protein
MTPTRPFRLAALAAAALLAACSSDSAVAPQLAPADLGAALGKMSLPSLAPAATSAGPAPVVTPLSAPDPSGCSFDAKSGGYTCPDIVTGGMTITRGFTLFDAAGNTQPKYDRTTTAAIRTELTAIGTITSGTTTLNVDQRQTMTLSGLLTGVHTLNGTSVSKLNGSVSNGLPVAQAMSSTQTLTVADVVLPSDAPGASPYPASGVLTMVGATTVGVLPAVTSRLVLTFNGTRSVPVSITVAGVTRQCTLDLAGQNGLVCGA